MHYFSRGPNDADFLGNRERAFEGERPVLQDFWKCPLSSAADIWEKEHHLLRKVSIEKEKLDKKIIRITGAYMALLGCQSTYI